MTRHLNGRIPNPSTLWQYRFRAYIFVPTRASTDSTSSNQTPVMHRDSCQYVFLIQNFVQRDQPALWYCSRQNSLKTATQITFPFGEKWVPKLKFERKPKVSVDFSLLLGLDLHHLPSSPSGVNKVKSASFFMKCNYEWAYEVCNEIAIGGRRTVKTHTGPPKWRKGMQGYRQVVV